MSTYYTPGAALIEGPQRPRKKRSWIRKAILPAAALFIGMGMGAAGAGGSQEPAAAPTPAPTVTETVEVKVPGPVETKTVEVPGPATVPPVCTVALDYADEGFTISSEVLGGLQAGLKTGDFSASDAGNAKLNALAPKWNAAKAACRLAAEK